MMSQSSSMPDLKSLPPYDLVVLGSGVLAFIASFFPYYGASVSGSLAGVGNFGSSSSSVTAWHSYSTLGLLLVLIGTIGAGAAIFARDSLPSLPVDARWAAAGLCVLGAFLYLIRLFTLPSRHANLGAGISVSEGVKWGGYFLLVIVLVNAAAAVMSALSSDAPVPWAGTTAGAGDGSASWSVTPPSPTAPPPPPAAQAPAAPPAPPVSPAPPAAPPSFPPTDPTP
jgi:hypothetical protein